MIDSSTDAVAQALLGVARALSTGGYTCLVEILEDGGSARRLNRPRPEEEAATWAQMTMVLESGPRVVITKTWVGVRFEGHAAEGAYVGALVARSQTGTVSSGDGARIQRMVDAAVSACDVRPSEEPDLWRQRTLAVAGGTR